MRANLSSFGDIRTIEDYKRAAQEFELNKRFKQAQMQEALFKASPEGRATTLPATLQVNNAIQKALDAGDYDTANRIAWLSRSQAYGIDTFRPQGNTQESFKPFAPQTVQPQNVPEQQPAGTPEYVPIGSSIMPTGVNHIAAQITSNAAMKKGAETQAQKNVELGMDPNIEAATRKAALKAEYEEKGRQSLPKLQRSLQSRELTEEFIQPKIGKLLQDAEGVFSTGFTGSIAGALPGTLAFNLKKDLDTLLANSGFDKLQEIRDNSPTGGALGAISEREIDLLQATWQNLLNSQNKEQFTANLQSFQNQRLRSLQNIQAAYQQDYQRFGGANDPYLPSPDEMAQGQSFKALQPYLEKELSPILPSKAKSGARQEMEALQGKFKNKNDINQLLDMYAPK